MLGAAAAAMFTNVTAVSVAVVAVAITSHVAFVTLKLDRLSRSDQPKVKSLSFTLSFKAFTLNVSIL
jgi:hypothetical protein